MSWCFLKIKFGDSLPIIVKIPSNNSEGNTCYMFMLWLCNCMIDLGCNLWVEYGGVYTKGPNYVV